jgi:tripartite ATP-independent transporter DctM subunit
MIADLFAEYLDIVMFLVLCAAILIGFPVVFTLTGIAVLFAGLGWLLGVFQLPLLGALGQRIFGIMTSGTLVAIPLFIFMGIVLERSRIAEDLLETMGRLFGTLRGGLAISVVVVGALLAASTGIVGATVVTMGLIALPSMLRHGYDRRLAAGTVVTAGTLGQIIPPSTMLIILSEVMSTAYQQAQFSQGLFTIDTISVGQVFAAALLPGLMLVGVYLVYIVARAVVSPAAAPALRAQEAGHVGALNILRMLVPPIVLIVAVLGSILGGLATPTEAAAVGAIGAILLAGFRLSGGRSNIFLGVCVAALIAAIAIATVTTLRPQRAAAGVVELGLAALAVGLCILATTGVYVAVWRLARARVLRDIAVRTMTISAMIFGTIIGASVFSLVFRGLGGDAHIEGLITAMPGGADGALLFVMALIFVAGCFLDFVEISVIILPIVAPALILLGLDPIWLAVLIAINLQTSFLTPPFGFSLFYLRGAAPPEITTWDIYRGVAPYIVLQIVGLFLVWFLPDIATMLPRALFG